MDLSVLRTYQEATTLRDSLINELRMASLVVILELPTAQGLRNGYVFGENLWNSFKDGSITLALI